MQIWVDADACPNIIKDILFRAAERSRVSVTLVANQQIKIPRSPHIKTVQVESGFDVADNYIAKHIQSGDLLITADIPLAAEAMEKGAQVLNPRGELYSIQTIRQRLVMRDLMDELRGSGIQTGGQPAMSQRERQAFANHLDSYLARLKRQIVS